jgi:hypothetical protein
MTPRFIWKFIKRSTQFTKVMRVMMKPRNTQMMFFMENNEGNGLEDTEVIHQGDREGDSNRIILSNKVTKVIKETKGIQTINKVTRETHKEETNNGEIFEVSQILEATTDLVTRWIPVIIS